MFWLYYLLLLFTLDLVLYKCLTEPFYSYNDCCNQPSILGFFEKSFPSNVCVCVSAEEAQHLIKKEEGGRGPWGRAPALLCLSLHPQGCPGSPPACWAGSCLFLCSLSWDQSDKWSRSWCQAHKEKNECAVHVTIFSFFTLLWVIQLLV